MTDSPLERFIKLFGLDDVPLNQEGGRFGNRLSENVEDRRKPRDQLSPEELAAAEAGDRWAGGILDAMERVQVPKGNLRDPRVIPPPELVPWEQVDPFGQEMSARLRNPHETGALEQRDASGNLTPESISNIMKGRKATGR